MKKRFLCFILLAFLCTPMVQAQFAKKQAVDISVGFGLSAPYDDVDVDGRGFYLQGEYVFTMNNWIDLRPYVGLILATTTTGDDALPGPNFRSDAEAGLFGLKARVKAPIPWVSPYIEGGIGGSIGTFATFTQFTDLQKSGLLYHIPLSIGLELGPNHNFDLAFTYYLHPTVEQFSGAAAVGISIPIK